MANKTDLIATDAHAVPRRMALKVLAAIGVAVPGATAHSLAAGKRPLTAGAQSPTELTLTRQGAEPAGTRTDPDMHHPVIDWERSLTEAQLSTLQLLCDLILPADDRSPAASTLGCHEFIDEWVSAPYPRQQDDSVLLAAGLRWLDEESDRRFGTAKFRGLSTAEQKTICDDICQPKPKSSKFGQPSEFFTLVRNLTCGAFFTTEAGLNDIGYEGNTPLPRWQLPPPEVLEHVGLVAVKPTTESISNPISNRGAANE